VRIEFHRADDEEKRTVATATWEGRAASVSSDDDDLHARLQRVFRPTSVAIDDASYRRMGTSGVVVVPPGDLGWFRAAAIVRAPAEAGLVPRFVPEITENGYDPAGNYRGFEAQIERLSARTDRR
jgi:hypothetical protein